MLFRFRYHEAGDHTHVRLFAGPNSKGLGMCGTIVFRNDEWKVFRFEVEYGEGSDSSFEFLPDHMPAEGQR